MAHLVDPSGIDIHEVDELGRRGPKYGVALAEKSAAIILSRLSEELHIYKASTLGYNNRLYFATAKSGRQFVIKVCGRYWKRLKTETEVVGLFLAARLHSPIPLPEILAWDSTGHEFGVEYTLMRRLAGIQLKELWKDLSFENKRLVLQQVGHLVVAYKSGSGGVNLLPDGKIGNFVVLRDGGESDGIEFDVGATLEGIGPWTSYKAFLRTQLEVKIESVRKAEGMERMKVLLPRVEKFLASLDTDEKIVDSHEFVFTHGDLNLQNLLVTFIDEVPTVTAALDWEWSGMFPAEEEFFCSFDFWDEDDGGESAELKSYFYSILEDGGVGTPRTIASFEQRKNLYDLRENLYPWYIADCDDVADAIRRAVDEVQCLLEKLKL